MILYIYYNLGYGELTVSWSTVDRNKELFEKDTKLILLGIIANNNTPVGINSEYITVNNNSNVNLTTADYAILTDSNIITIDYKNAIIKTNDNISVIINDSVIKLATKNTSIRLSQDDITDMLINDSIYSLVSVKRETYLEDRTIKLVKLEDVYDCGIEGIRITDIRGYIINHNQNAISVIDKKGNNVKLNSNITNGIMYPFSNDTLLNISTQQIEGDFVATVSVSATLIIDNENNKVYNLDDTYHTDNILMNPNGLYLVIMNTLENKVYLYEPDTEFLDTKPLLYLGCLDGISQGNSYTAHGDVLNHVTINGIRPSNYISYGGPDPDKEFDWKNNRLVLPSDLYLIKNVDYSIMCQNISMSKFIDNDDIMYELATPNKTVQSENSLNINCPVEGEFETILAGKFKGNNTVILKDVNIHVTDKTHTGLNILCIGDDTVDLNLPGYLKYYLDQFEASNSSFLGTVSNTNSINGYGLKNLPSEKGEGRKGWRLTDFMCHTKRNDDTNYYKSNNPFMNNETKLFDFSQYMESNNYESVDVVVISLGLNDILGYHTESSVENIQNLSIYQNLEIMPVYYKEMISSIHKFDPNIKIIIDSVMTIGTNDTFNKNSLLWAETLFYELKDLPNVFTIGSYIGQGLLTCVNKKSIEDYPQSTDINDTRIGSSVSNKDINGTVQSNKALYIASAILNVIE